MKKLMIAAFAAAGIATLATADVTSANIVGYTTKNAPKNGFRIASLSFEGIARADGKLCINDLAATTTTVDFDDSEAYKTQAPEMQICNAGGGYDSYYFVNNALYLDSEGNEANKPGWVDTTGVLVSPEYVEMEACEFDGVVIPGTAVWFKDPLAANTITANGQVADTEVEVDCAEGFRIRANVFPYRFCINDESKVSFKGINATVPFDDGLVYQQTAPEVQLQNAGGGYDNYFYVSNALYLDSEGNEANKPGWVDTTGVLVSPEYVEMEACEFAGEVFCADGFWTRGGKGGSFKMTFKK